MNSNLFEEYLMEVHAKDYYGTDDNMPDSFNAWLEKLDSNDIMQYAELAMVAQQNKFLKAINLAAGAIGELEKIKVMAKQ